MSQRWLSDNTVDVVPHCSEARRSVRLTSYPLVALLSPFSWPEDAPESGTSGQSTMPGLNQAPCPVNEDVRSTITRPDRPY